MSEAAWAVVSSAITALCGAVVLLWRERSRDRRTEVAAGGKEQRAQTSASGTERRTDSDHVQRAYEVLIAQMYAERRFQVELLQKQQQLDKSEHMQELLDVRTAHSKELADVRVALERCEEKYAQLASHPPGR